MHGFYLDEEEDADAIRYNCGLQRALNGMQVRDNILDKIKSIPEYEVKITLDLDISD